MDERKYSTAEEVSDRYRGGISVGTLRNWRAMWIGPTFIKIGKAVLYPINELEVWDQRNKVTCRASKRAIMNVMVRDDYVVAFGTAPNRHPHCTYRSVILCLTSMR